MVVLKRAHATLSALALAFGLAACGGGSKTISVDAIFKQIGDLPRFATVQASDIVIGSVRAIKLDGYDARVTLRIRSDADIPNNTRALIRSTSLLGEEFVELRAPAEPSSQPLRDGDVIPLQRTDKIPGLDDALIGLGRLLEGGTTADLATIIHSTAEIVRDKSAELGQIFSQLRTVSGVLAGRAPDVSRAIGNLDTAISTFAEGSDVISRALSSTAQATTVLAEQRANLSRLVGALDNTSAVLARYTTATTPASDRSIEDLTAVLDKVITTTGDLDKTLSSLATFTDLWPRAVPGDYLQQDVVFNLTNVAPPASGSSSASISRIVVRSAGPTLGDLLWGAVR